jgi:hypothetical protein
MKEAEKNIFGGDPYECKKCHSILNKYSNIRNKEDYDMNPSSHKLELQANEWFWQCEFCSYPNILKIDKEEIPTKDDMVYMLESELENEGSATDSTTVFCIDASGSMNTTSEIEGKMDLKFGLSKE